MLRAWPLALIAKPDTMLQLKGQWIVLPVLRDINQHRARLFAQSVRQGNTPQAQRPPVLHARKESTQMLPLLPVLFVVRVNIQLRLELPKNAQIALSEGSIMTMPPSPRNTMNFLIVHNAGEGCTRMFLDLLLAYLASLGLMLLTVLSDLRLIRNAPFVGRVNIL